MYSFSVLKGNKKTKKMSEILFNFSWPEFPEWNMMDYTSNEKNKRKNTWKSQRNLAHILTDRTVFTFGRDNNNNNKTTNLRTK